jgi:hypothetical protein
MIYLRNHFLLACAAAAMLHCSLPQGLVRAQTLLVTEFMASNTSVLQDEDGDFPDWIEIYNAGPDEVNLEGWSLTDASGNLSKWSFPATNIGPSGFMVIFASGKDRRAPGHTLHTNFKIEAGGEYLGLATPEGIIAWDYAPLFPPQVPDVSFGIGMISTAVKLLESGASATVLIPSNDDLGASWTLIDFDDSTWQEGVTGIGFENWEGSAPAFSAAVLESNPDGYWRLNEFSGTVAHNLGALGAAANGEFLGQPVLNVAGPRPPEFPQFDPDNMAACFGGGSSVAIHKNLLDGLGSFTIAGWIRPTEPQSERTGLFGQNDAIEFGFISPGSIQLWTANGGDVSANYPFPLHEWHFIVATGDGNELRIYYDGVLAGVGGWQTSDYGRSPFSFNIGGGGIFDVTGNQFTGDIGEVAIWRRGLTASEVAAIYEGVNVTGPWLREMIRTDLVELMHGVNSSAFIRVPFNVDDPGSLDRLILRINYDDGFVAYLNGHEIVRRNAPDDLHWNSAATAARSGTQTLSSQEIVTSSVDHLIAGSNVLAIHGLNTRLDDGDFLILPELDGISFGLATTEYRYFRLPTPGAPNGSGTADLGPVISLVQHAPHVPKPGENLLVSAKVTPSFNPLSSVTLHYRIMFGPIHSMPMMEDEEGMFAAAIPTETAGQGEMVRYYIEAADAGGYSSRWPLFEQPLNSAEYIGTIVAALDIQSQLPVVHLFIENQGAENTYAGTRCSLFYLDEFHDNIQINLHGQTSTFFPKKSYNLDFNKDHRFRYSPGSPRVKDIKLLSNYADKAKVRNALAYDMIREAGSDGHFCFQVRVELNGSFFSVADLMEDADDRWLERLGRDPNGALYKIYDNLSNALTAQKKTRKNECSSDLQSFIDNLDESRPISARVAYAYDNIDLPQTISYFAALALISSQDHGHKNFFVYCDSLRSGEWAILPWDVDLSWGRNWLDAEGYLTDTLFQDNVLNFYNSSQQNKPGNRLYNLIFEHPDFRQMYLRRLRTVMDKILQAPDTPQEQLQIEARIMSMLDLMEPPGLTPSDAQLDFLKWGSWGLTNQTRAEAARIIETHLPGRRDFLFNSPDATVLSERIPDAQPPDITIQIGAVQPNPVSGRQAEEFIQLLNPNPFAVDISGWQIESPVRFTFRPGTVIPGGGSLYVSPDVTAFRARQTAPGAGQAYFVQGPYQGQLSARGDTIQLMDDTGREVAMSPYAADPTQAQQQFRITEVMYNPPPPPEDSPFSTQDFEFVELRNIGSTQLDLAGIRFTEGIAFDFTDSAIASLDPGAYLVVVRNIEAFQSRYGEHILIAGEYEGLLDNAGERIQLIDAVGELILDFSYDDLWHRSTDGRGFSLVVVDELADHVCWASEQNWRASSDFGGSPGESDPDPQDTTFLRLTIIPGSHNAAILRFHAKPHRSYTAQQTDNIQGQWSELEHYPDLSQELVIETAVEMDADVRFYRILVNRTAY